MHYCEARQALIPVVTSDHEKQHFRLKCSHSVSFNSGWVEWSHHLLRAHSVSLEVLAEGTEIHTRWTRQSEEDWRSSQQDTSNCILPSLHSNCTANQLGWFGQPCRTVALWLWGPLPQYSPRTWVCFQWCKIKDHPSCQQYTSLQPSFGSIYCIFSCSQVGATNHYVVWVICPCRTIHKH